MDAPEQRQLIERIHDSGRRLVVSVTGGGSGAVAALLQVPGASASVLEVLVPYAADALREWLGGSVDQFCSERTARAMAMRAFERACALSPADPHALVGIGATASLTTTRPKRGAHRIHVAWQTSATTVAISCNFKSPTATRDEEERVATHLILNAAADACALPVPPIDPRSLETEVTRREMFAPQPWIDLVLGRRETVRIPEPTPADDRPMVLFPGAFNPLHWGHEQMAAVASSRCRHPVTFELSVTNVDKPTLDYLEIADRVQRFNGRDLLLTRAPTFVEKARLAPGCTFVVGTDTIERIVDPTYYEGDARKRDAAINEIARLGCRFLVFGRSAESEPASLSETNIPSSLRALCDEVPLSQFRADISSTELRRGQRDRTDD